MKKPKVLIVGLLAAVVALTGVRGDTFTLYDTAVTGFGILQEVTPYLMSAEIDFSEDEASTDDVFKVIPIKAPALVKAVFYRVPEALMDGTNTASTVFQIGDSGSATRYGSGIACTLAATWAGGAIGSTATHISTGEAETNTVTSTSATGWHFYGADDYIAVKTTTGGADDGEFEVKVLVLPLE